MEEFELLLSCPFTWKPSKICKFWNDFHNHIKAKFIDDMRICEPAISQFCKRLEIEARNCYLLGPIRNWREAIGHRDFDLVTKFEFNLQLNCSTSVEHLVRIIRNKYEHPDGLSDNEKMELGWFRMKEEKLELDEKLFSSYWISKFPKLVPFLWNQFGFLKVSFPEYYPSTLENYADIRLEDFVAQLVKACSKQLDEGYLAERFTSIKSSCSIELRTLSGNLLSKLLNGSSIMEIIASKAKVTVMWNGDPVDSMEYTPIPSNSNDHNQYFWNSRDICAYIFSSESDKVGKSVKDCDQRLLKSRITVFTGQDSIESTITKLSNDSAFERNSVGWWDLSEQKRKQIEFSDKFNFILQSSNILFRDLLPKLSHQKNGVLADLGGNELNTLLKTHRLPIFQKHVIPTVDPFYRERTLYNRTTLHSSIFHESLENDQFIVLKNDLEPMPANPSYQVKVISPSEIFPRLIVENLSSKTVLVADTEIKNLMRKLDQFRLMRDPSKSIHFLRYLGNEIFQWVYTAGPVYSVKSHFTIAARKAGVMTESQLLESLKNEKIDERLIFIADQPGMGKSQILFSIAKSILNSKKNNNKRIVVVLNASQFAETFKRNYDPSEKKRKLLGCIIKTVIDITCSEKFETSLVTHLLNEKSNLIQFEIMLDGLDEITSDSRELVLNAVMVIDKNPKFPVRVWVTLRDHMLDAIRESFRTLGYKLDPFSRSEQVNFLVDFWSRNFSSEMCAKNLVKMQTFAFNCIENCLLRADADLAGIPLQCRMIGEIYERQVINLDFDLEKREDFHLIDLYQNMLERKMEIYLREKKMLPMSITSNDSLFQLTRLSIEHFLEFLSIRLIFPNEIYQFFGTNLLISADPNMISTLFTTALEHGVLQDMDPLKFIHRTFAEYFVAQYVYAFIMNSKYRYGNLDEICPLFHDLLWNKVLAVKRSISGYKFVHPSICHFLDKFLSRAEMALPSFYDDCIKNLMGDVTGFKYNTEDTPPVTEGLDFAFQFVAAAGHVDTPIPYVNIIRLLAQSRTRLFELLIFTLGMEEYRVTTKLIEILDISTKDYSEIRDLNSAKYGIVHFLLSPSNSYWHDLLLDIEGMKSILKSVAEKNPALINERDATGRTPLLFYVNEVLPFDPKEFRTLKDTLGVLELLLSLGADIHAVDQSMNSVLHLGKFYYGKSGGIFLEEPFLYIIVGKMYLQVIKFLLEKGFAKYEVNRFNDEGYTPFLSFLHLVDKFLITGCYRNCLNGRDLIMKVVNDVFKLFQEHGNDLNAQDVNGESVLCTAIKTGFSLTVIAIIVELGASISPVSKNSQGTIHTALETGAISVTKYLIAKCPSCLYDRDRSGKSLSECQSIKTLRKYLQHKVNSEMSEYSTCSYSTW